MTKVLRGCGLVRVSTKAQADKGYSLEEQQATLREYFQRHGITLVEMLVDDGVSGKIADRPAVRKALTLAEAGAIDLIAAVRLDRIGRENRVIQDIIGRFRDRNVGFTFVDHGSGDTAAERLQLNVLAAVAEFEWEGIRAKTLEGRLRKAKSGKVPVNAKLLGYHTVTKAEAQVIPEYAERDGELIVVETEAQTVREMFRRYAAGEGTRAIATWLNREGILTKRGNRWHQAVVHQLLQNPAYVGRFAYGKRQHRQIAELTPGGKPRARRTPVAPEGWIEIKCPPILVDGTGAPDERLFQRVQDRLQGTRDMFRGRPSNEWLLGGVVVCGICLTRHGTNRRCVGWRTSNEKKRPGWSLRRYVCGSRNNTSLDFCGTSYRADDLEQRVALALLRAIEPGELGRRARALAAATRTEVKALEAQLQAVDAEMHALDTEERKLADLALHGFSVHIVQERLEPVKARRAALDAKRRDLTDRIHRPEAPSEAEQIAEQVAARLRQMLNGNHDQHTLQDLYRFLVRVTLWPGAEPDVEIRVASALSMGSTPLPEG